MVASPRERAHQSRHLVEQLSRKKPDRAHALLEPRTRDLDGACHRAPAGKSLFVVTGAPASSSGATKLYARSSSAPAASSA